jgi:hypothetical protein
VSRDSRILLGTLVIAVAIGIVTPLAIGVLSSYRRGTDATATLSLLPLMVYGSTWSMPFTVPGGLVAAGLMIQTARRQPPVRSVSEWLWRGLAWGNAYGALCLGLLAAVLSRSLEMAGMGAVFGGLLGSVAGVIIGAYCHRLVQREAEWFDRIAGRATNGLERPKAAGPRARVGGDGRILRAALLATVLVSLVATLLSACAYALYWGRSVDLADLLPSLFLLLFWNGSWSTTLSLPCGTLLGRLMARVAGSQPPLRSLSQWLWFGLGSGALCGGPCLGLPYAVFWRSTAFVVLGSLLGSIAGAIVAVYGHRLQRGERPSG